MRLSVDVLLSRAQIRPRVVKLVDTGDLKSPAHCERAGSSPAPGTTVSTAVIFFTAHFSLEIRFYAGLGGFGALVFATYFF